MRGAALRARLRACENPTRAALPRPAAVKVITGSFQGVLRIYLPQDRDYKIEHLLLEQDLGRPILQLLAGRFSP